MRQKNRRGFDPGGADGREFPVCRTGSGQARLGLVAEALLVAICLHALAALVLTDLGLSTFFEVSHDKLVV